jgi:hypothetical protein
MNIDILFDQTVDQIQNKIDEGSEILENKLILRTEIDDALKRNKCCDEPSQLSANELMINLTKNLIKVWPSQRFWAYQTIEEQMKPLREIATILNSEEVNKFVHVRDNPCVMKESRMPVNDFKKIIGEGLFHEQKNFRR